MDLLGDRAPDPGDRAPDPVVAAVPQQRQGPAPTGRALTGGALTGGALTGGALTGGEVPAEVLRRLAARLAEQERAGSAAASLRARPALTAAVGAAAVLAVLLVAMALLGRLL